MARRQCPAGGGALQAEAPGAVRAAAAWAARAWAWIPAAVRAALRWAVWEFGPWSPAQCAQERLEKASTLGRTRRAGRLRVGRAAEPRADRMTRAMPSA